MQYRYLPMTEEDKLEMLQEIGVSTVDDLFEDIPERVRFHGELQIPEQLSEPELLAYLRSLADKNIHLKKVVSFLGAGVYEHYIPSVVDHVISRSEFYSAYTPYQPEISQGELQAIFEFQTMISELTGMNLANSSMYDGPTALAEAAMMACGVTKKRKILVSGAVHPEARDVLLTNAYGQNLEVVELKVRDGMTDVDSLKEHYDDQTACVLVQYPNFFGSIENLQEMEKIIHAEKALFIVSSNPLALGLLKPPGEFGADIVVGDAQPFGIPTQFGGPHCGFFATTTKWMRKIPGRLVGQTTDDQGRRGFVLTLQAREQHIRREKATSNICSNQALNALAASVAMSAIGKAGVKEIAGRNVQKAAYAKQQFQKHGFKLPFGAPTFNEFVVKIGKSVSDVNKALIEKGFIGGFDLERTNPSYKGYMLIAVTELRTKQEIDAFVTELGGIVNES